MERKGRKSVERERERERERGRERPEQKRWEEETWRREMGGGVSPNRIRLLPNPFLPLPPFPSLKLFILGVFLP